MNAGTDILTSIGDFLLSLIRSIREGVLFIGSPLDLVVALADIIVLAFFFYYVLAIVRDSRAWQLLKGIVLIALFALLSNMVGLNAVGFLLNNTISVFAIAFVVIFQPELRRALETVGRSGFTVLFSDDKEASSGKVSRTIESIVTACEYLAEHKTGALIVLERTTPLGDLAEQENAVTLDAAVSTTLLKQIFYLGSPLHDGAVLVRGGRVAAARVHIPLSDNYHLRKDFGTRHRAGIGASEIGDSIAIIVSEERGVISLAIEGHLYVLDNGDALRTQLHRLLNPDDEKTGRHIFVRLNKGALDSARRAQNRRQRVLTLLTSIFLALALWLYVQVTVNPIITDTFDVPLIYENSQILEEKGFEAQYLMSTIKVTLSGRKRLLTGMNARDITAFVDMSTVDVAGIKEMPVKVRTNTNLYTRTNSLIPNVVAISVRPRTP